MQRRWLVLFYCVLVWDTAQAGGLVRWQDAKGNWHYSNHVSVDPNLRPREAPRPKRAEANLAAPGAQVLLNPVAVQQWLLALRRETAGMTVEQERAYLAQVKWPSGPIAWKVTVQEVMTTDFLDPSRGAYQVRARTLQPVRTGGLPVSFEGRNAAQLSTLRSGQRVLVRGETALDVQNLQFIDQHGYLYSPISIRMKTVESLDGD